MHTKISGTPLTKEASTAFLPLLITFYAVEYYFLDRLWPDLAPWISLVFASLLMTLYTLAQKSFSNRLESQFLVFSFSAVVLFHSVYLNLFPHILKPWLFVVIVLAVTFAPTKNLKTKYSMAIPLIALFLILAIEYYRMLWLLLYKGEMTTAAVAIISALGLGACVTMKREECLKSPIQIEHILLGAAHTLVIASLYRLTSSVGSLAVSGSWLTYAIIVLGISYSRKDSLMAKSAVFVLAFAAGKALLYDASSTATIIRILCLLVTGVVLYGSGFVLRKVSHWKT